MNWDLHNCRAWRVLGDAPPWWVRDSAFQGAHVPALGAFSLALLWTLLLDVQKDCVCWYPGCFCEKKFLYHLQFFKLKKILCWRILATVPGHSFSKPSFPYYRGNGRIGRALTRNSKWYWHYCTFWMWWSPQYVNEFVNLLFYVRRWQNIVAQIWLYYLTSRLTPWNYERVCGLAHLKSASFTKWR